MNICSTVPIYVFSNCYSNVRLIFGKVRSRLHRSRLLQVNSRLNALDEIYKIYTYASLGEKNRIENEIMKMYTNKKYSTHVCTALNTEC